MSKAGLRFSRESEALYNQALELKEQGEFESAKALLNQFVELNPSATVHLVPLAEILAEQGFTSQAIECLRIHINLKPLSWIGSVGLYHCLLSEDRFTEALEEAERFRLIFAEHSAGYSERAKLEIQAYLTEALELAGCFQK